MKDRYDRIADGFGSRLGALTEDQWALPTPCAEWTVRDLVEHVIAAHHRMLAQLEGGNPTATDTDDLLGSWQEARTRVADALADTSRAATPIANVGEQPFENLAGIVLCADVLIHTWDLARATGQNERLDEEGISRAWEFMGPNDVTMRGPKGFGPKVSPDPDANRQTKFLNFCGRAV